MAGRRFTRKEQIDFGSPVPGSPAYPGPKPSPAPAPSAPVDPLPGEPPPVEPPPPAPSPPPPGEPAPEPEPRPEPPAPTPPPVSPPGSVGSPETPFGGGTFERPGAAGAAPFRSIDFFSNRFVSGPEGDDRPLGYPGGGVSGPAAALRPEDLRRLFGSILKRVR